MIYLKYFSKSLQLDFNKIIYTKLQNNIKFNHSIRTNFNLFFSDNLEICLFIKHKYKYYIFKYLKLHDF